MPPSWTRALSENVSTVGLSAAAADAGAEELRVGLPRQLG